MVARPDAGRDGKTLRQRMEESERLVAESGVYEHVLSVKEADPVTFEVLFTRLLQTLTNAREVALSISASPSTREQGEIIFGLYTPEGDAVCLSTGLMIHVHTMSRAIKWMIANDYESKVGFREGEGPRLEPLRSIASVRIIVCGVDPALDGPGLARLVAGGQARYVLLGGEYSLRGGNLATHAVLRACTELAPPVWHSPVPYPFGLALFDCAGHERALAAA